MGGVPPSLRRDSDQGRPLRCRSEFMGAVARLHGVGRRDGTAWPGAIATAVVVGRFLFLCWRGRLTTQP
jgi:hypothetical protein